MGVFWELWIMEVRDVEGLVEKMVVTGVKKGCRCGNSIQERNLTG